MDDGVLAIHAAVEGIIDEAVAQKLIFEAGGKPGTIYGKKGKNFLQQKMIYLASRSRRRAIRMDMVPRQNSGRSEGPAYTSRMIEYVQDFWRPEVAGKHAESLRRAITCLRRIIVEIGDNSKRM